MVLVLALVTPVSLARAGDTVTVTGRDTEVTIHPGDTILFTGGWGACTRGQVMAWARGAHLGVSLDGTVLETDVPWSVGPAPLPVPFPDPNPCMNGGRWVYWLDTDPSDWPNGMMGWRATWVFPLSFEEVGDFEVEAVAWTMHAGWPDGGDYDGDGKPDGTGPGPFVVGYGSWTIHVVAAP
jgi:hypothetical protein